MMFSKPRHGRSADPAWPTIVIAILVGLIVARAVSTGFARRAVNALLARIEPQAPSRERSPLAAAGAPSSTPSPLPEAVSRAYEVPGMASTMSGQSPFDRSASHEGTSEPSSPVDSPPAEPDPAPATGGTGTEPFDELGHDIPAVAPEEQPLDAAELTAGSDLPDSVPADGTSVCPADYPIKGNGRSGIYHPPGAFAYERTVPSICFRTAAAAERAGFRAAVH